MRINRAVPAVTFAAAACAVLAFTGLPTSSGADPCPDAEVVFARGTGEPVGVGGVGQAFVDALRAETPTKSVAVYAVNYAASNQFDDRIAFAQTVVDGIRDAGSHVMATAAACPATRIVLGGYSQGAVVAGFTTASAVPEGVPAQMVPAPMPAQIADHVAAVTLFGMPSAAWMQSYGAPPVTVGAPYTAKTIQLCAPDDTICDGAAGRAPSLAHMMYGMNGMVSQAATYAAQRINGRINGS